MATTRCKSCKAVFPAKAKVCQVCGAKVVRTSFLVKALSVGFLCLLLSTCYSVMSGRHDQLKTAEQTSAEQQANAKSAQKKSEEAAADAAKKAVRDREVQISTKVLAAKAAVTKILRDPESAKFGKVGYREPGIVCGFVNAKNGFGGYTGEKSFISLGTPELTWLEGQSKDFQRIWNERCATK